LIDEINWE